LKSDAKVKEIAKSDIMVEFAPEEKSESEVVQDIQTHLTAENQCIESLENILEYLRTVSFQVNDLIIPNLKNFNIDANSLSKEVESLLNKVIIKLDETKREERSLSGVDPRDFTEETASSNWKSIDWGKRRQSNK